MVQTRKQLSQIQKGQHIEKQCSARSPVPISGRITNFFQMRKRKNDSSDKKDVEVLGKRLRKEVNVKQTTVCKQMASNVTPLGIFDRLPYHIFDTFAEFSSWRTLINLSHASRSCSSRIINFIPRDVCVEKFVRDIEMYELNKNIGAEDPFVNLGQLCRTVFQSNECSQELMTFCRKATPKVSDPKRWARFLFIVSSLLVSHNGGFDHCRQLIEFILTMKTPVSEETKAQSIKDLLSSVVYRNAGELAAEEMKVRAVIRDVFIDQPHMNDEQQAIWMTCLMRTFPKLQQQARLLMIALAPTTMEDGVEVIDWRSLCDRDVVDRNDAERRIKPLAIFISKLINLGNLKDRSLTWSNTELFNLIEEVSTCPEPWAFDNFIAFLIQEPTLIPIALTARMTHDYVEEAGNLVSAMKTLLYRWKIPLSLGFSEAFMSTMKSLSNTLRREFLCSVHDALSRALRTLITCSRREIEEETSSQSQFFPLLQEVTSLL